MPKLKAACPLCAGPMAKHKGGLRCLDCLYVVSQKAKAKRPEPVSDPVRPRKTVKASIGSIAPINIPIPQSLLGAKVTSRAVKSGAYSRKVLEWLASYAIPLGLKDLMDQSASGKTAATVKLLEIYEILQTPKGISIINNDNRSVSVDARRSDSEGEGKHERRDFEAVARMLDEARTKRIEQGNPLAVIEVESFAETPEGMSK